MLSKEKRIPRSLFGFLLQSQKFGHSPHFSLRMASAPKTQVAVSVSKKISKKAVTRNLVRRRAYKALGDNFSQISPGLYLFMAKPGAEKLKGEKLEAELIKLVSSIKS